MECGNLYQQIPAPLPAEISESLMASGPVRIERIVSRGHVSAAGFWYDQNENEWVLLVQGEARLRFKEGDRVVHLTPGAYVNIAAHVQHRVDWTKADGETIWLAVFY